MPKQYISNDMLIDEAFKLANDEGLSNLSVRKLAKQCNMSPGSLYTYFPTKAALIEAVVRRLYAVIFKDDFCVVREGERFVDYLRRLDESMREAVRVYEGNWFKEVQKLTYDERQACKTAEDCLFEHIEAKLIYVFGLDDQVRIDSQTELSPDELCSFVLNCMLQAIRDSRVSEAMFRLIELSIY